MRRPRNPTAQHWGAAAALLVIGFSCTCCAPVVALLPTTPIPPENELTIYEGIPEKVIATERKSLRQGTRRNLDFTLNGHRIGYSGSRFEDVLQAAQKGEKFRAGIGNGNALITLTAGRTEILNYAASVQERTNERPSPFVCFIGVPFVLIGGILTAIFVMRRRAYLAYLAENQ